MKKDIDKIEELKNKIQEGKLAVSKASKEIRHMENKVYESKREFIEKYLKYDIIYNYIGDNTLSGVNSFKVTGQVENTGQYNMNTYTNDDMNQHILSTEAMFDLFTSTSECVEILRKESIDKILNVNED